MGMLRMGRTPTFAPSVFPASRPLRARSSHAFSQCPKHALEPDLPAKIASSSLSLDFIASKISSSRWAAASRSVPGLRW